MFAATLGRVAGDTPASKAPDPIPHAKALEFVTPPYLQNVKPDGITLMWELTSAVASVVDYGPDLAYGGQQSSTVANSGSGTYIYKCRLTSLEPGSVYYYRIRANGQSSEGGSFTTAPSGSPSFSFSVWADSQGSNHGAYAADPDEPTKSMMQHMADHGVALGVGVGDLAENGASYADTRRFYLNRVARLLGSSAPWFVAWGNHDQGRDAVIRRFADLPSADRPGGDPGYGSYAFNYAGCHFICIDYASASTDIENWLEADLQSPPNQNAKFTFLFVHVPPYCELWIDGDAYYRARLVPLMEAYGVDVCFSGHTHEYSRGYRNGVYYCVTGGGSWLDLPEVLVFDWDHMTVGGYHAIPGIPRPSPVSGGGLVNEYVRVDVDGDSFTASMIGFVPNGRVIGVMDRFSMSSNPLGRPPDTPRLTGPTTLNVLEASTLVFRSSPFSDPDPDDTHEHSLWRLSRSADTRDTDAILLERITGPGQFVCSIDTRDLTPGQTVFATVRHVATDGQASAFSLPVAVRLTPETVVITHAERSLGAIDLQWSGPPGRYQPQWRAGLVEGPWINVGEPIEASPPSAVHLPTQGLTGFYRLLWLGP